MTDRAPKLDSEPLPPLYQRWLDDLLGGGIPRESEATCSDCAMCSPSAPDGDAAYFLPEAKCCTHMPTLANYLVGRILLDESARGRASTITRIRARVAVTPLGLGRPRAYAALHREGGAEAFGRSRALLCPHYQSDSGECGIWQHRDAVCSTWFCKHVRGAVGFTFWSRSLRPLLAAVETALARWCVLELGIGEEALALIFAPAPAASGREIDGIVNEDAYATAWGNFRDREEELFVACAQRVAPLSWKDVISISGSEVRARAEILLNSYRRLLSSELPARARMAPLHVVRREGERVHLATYSEYDSIDVPSSLVDILHRFDAGTLDDTVQALARDGINVAPEMIRYLLDVGVLEEPPR